MCTYALARFSCRHEIWGRRIKLCTIGEDFLHKEIEIDCTFRGAHPMKTMVNPQPCYKCMQTKALPLPCRAKLQEARLTFRERWPEVSKVDGKYVDTRLRGGDKYDSVQEVVELSPSVNSAAKPPARVEEGSKPTSIPEPNAIAPSLTGGLSSPPQKDDKTVQNTSPSSKATPSRLSRLARPTRKMPEKAATPPRQGSKTAPLKTLSKLPKPGFMRKSAI